MTLIYSDVFPVVVSERAFKPAAHTPFPSYLFIYPYVLWPIIEREWLHNSFPELVF
jgi:hypothetical protein